MTKPQIYYTVISFNNFLLNQPRNEKKNKATTINIDGACKLNARGKCRTHMS